MSTVLGVSTDPSLASSDPGQSSDLSPSSDPSPGGPQSCELCRLQDIPNVANLVEPTIKVSVVPS